MEQQLRARLAASLVLAYAFVAPAAAQQAPTKVPLEWAAGASSVDPTFAEVSIAKELGYFRHDGIELDVRITSVAGGAGVLPVVSSGQAHVGYTGAEQMISTAARGQNTGMAVFFNQNREIMFSVAVLPDSPIKSYQDLKGKVVGGQVVPSAMTGYLTGLMKSIGISDKEFEIVGVGAGAGAISELRKGNVAAVLMADTVFASLENAGVTFRYLDPGNYARKYTTGGIFAKRDYIKSSRRELCVLGRGLAMGAEFALVNPEAAVRMHWKHYPESKPKGADDATALRHTMHVLQSRSAKWDPSKQADPRHGASEGANWMSVVEAMGLAGRLTPATVDGLYTNEIVDCANAFDKAQVREAARAYKMQ